MYSIYTTEYFWKSSSEPQLRAKLMPHFWGTMRLVEFKKCQRVCGYFQKDPNKIWYCHSERSEEFHFLLTNQYL
jgi:hypothetical protein